MERAYQICAELSQNKIPGPVWNLLVSGRSSQWFTIFTAYHFYRNSANLSMPSSWNSEQSKLPRIQLDRYDGIKQKGMVLISENLPVLIRPLPFMRLWRTWGTSIKVSSFSIAEHVTLRKNPTLFKIWSCRCKSVVHVSQRSTTEIRVLIIAWKSYVVLFKALTVSPI